MESEPLSNRKVIRPGHFGGAHGVNSRGRQVILKTVDSIGKRARVGELAAQLLNGASENIRALFEIALRMGLTGSRYVRTRN